MSEPSPTGPSTPPILTISEGRALVPLNRPKEHNRLEPADLAALREIFDRVDADPSIRALVITGTGKSFSSGFHIGALANSADASVVKRGSATTSASEAPPNRADAKSASEAQQKSADASVVKRGSATTSASEAPPNRERDPDAFEKMVDRLEALRVPTIAALNGGVYGGSTDLALACDFRIGIADDADVHAGGQARHRLLSERAPALRDAARGGRGEKDVPDGRADRLGGAAAHRLSR